MLLSATDQKSIPKYLQAVTRLEIEGNIGAETAASVANLREQLDSPEGVLDETTKQIKHDHQMEARYNIVIIGKSGVGKSSLINYVYGKNVREAGVGKPITQRGFYHVNFEAKGVPVTLFDSRGLETGGKQAEEWIADLNDELRQRGTDQSVERWFHTVLYCIAASSKRIEDFELNIIRLLQQEKYRVVVVFTKYDLASEDAIGQLRSIIRGELGRDIPFVCAASVSEKLRSGLTKQEGREDLLSEIYTGFWESISFRLPDRCVAILRRFVGNWRRAKKQYVTRNATARNAQDIADFIRSDARQLIDLLKSERTVTIVNSEIEQTLQLYQRFAEMVDSKITKSFQTLTLPRVRLPEYKDPQGLVADMRRLFNLRGAAKQRLNELVDAYADNMNRFVDKVRPNIEKIIKDSLKKIC